MLYQESQNEWGVSSKRFRQGPAIEIWSIRFQRNSQQIRQNKLLQSVGGRGNLQKALSHKLARKHLLLCIISHCLGRFLDPRWVKWNILVLVRGHEDYMLKPVESLRIKQEEIVSLVPRKEEGEAAQKNGSGFLFVWNISIVARGSFRRLYYWFLRQFVYEWVFEILRIAQSELLEAAGFFPRLHQP